MMRLKNAQALQVATLAEGALVGKLDDLQFELETGNIFGFRFTKGMFSKAGGAPADAVERLGKDLIYVPSESVIDWSGVARSPVEGRAWAVDYRGTKVMTRRGETVGTVEDLVITLGPARVAAVVLDGDRVVALDHDVAVGRDAVILADASLAKAPAAAEAEGGDWWKRMRGMVEGEKK